MKHMKFSALALTAALLLSTACGANAAGKTGDVTELVLSDERVTVDGKTASTDETAAVYTGADIVYYEDRETYTEGGAYGEGSDSEKHSAAEAGEHTVVTITQAGTYRLSGKLSMGQIAVDLGKKAKDDPEAVVTLILDNVDVKCTVAPALIFYNVYECDREWVAYADIAKAMESLDDNCTDAEEAFKHVQELTSCTTGCGSCYDEVIEVISEIMDKR